MPGKSVRRLALALGGGLLAVVVIVVALICVFLFNFPHSAPAARYAAPRSALEAQRQDLDYFAKVLALDRAFTAATRAAADARVSELRSLSEALPQPKLRVALMQVMALADNGHTRMNATADQGTLILPIRLSVFA